MKTISGVLTAALSVARRLGEHGVCGVLRCRELQERHLRCRPGRGLLPRSRSATPS